METIANLKLVKKLVNMLGSNDMFFPVMFLVYLLAYATTNFIFNIHNCNLYIFQTKKLTKMKNHSAFKSKIIQFNIKTKYKNQSILFLHWKQDQLVQLSNVLVITNGTLTISI
jgi:hypothetical protein